MGPEQEAEEAPRRYALRISARARDDIEAAATRFVELSGAQVANEWKDGLYEAIASLATTPRRQVAPENNRFRQEVRQLVYRRRPGAPAYRVLFTIREPEDDAPYVRILHVRHGARRPITRAEAHAIEAEE